VITTYELVKPDGTPLVNISKIAADRKWSRRRNNAGNVSFKLSMDQWGLLCQKIGVHPRELLRKNWTEVRVKEGDVYVAAGQVQYLKTGLGARTIEVQAPGYLDLFRKRRTAPLRIFTAADGSDIAWTMIDESQNLPNGQLYIIRGANQATSGPHDRTYKRTVIKDGLQAFGNIQFDPFDIEITPLKEFNTYRQLGSSRPDIAYIWGKNIIDADITEDTTDLVNEVDALGSGFGDDAVAEVIIDNETSQADNGLCQDVITANATDNSDGGLDREAAAYLAAWSVPVVLLDVQVDGGKPPYVTDYGLGDYIYLDLTGHPWLDGYKGMFRVQEQACSISDDNQKVVTLTVSQ
jgi:hypothetical protein